MEKRRRESFVNEKLWECMTEVFVMTQCKSSHDWTKIEKAVTFLFEPVWPSDDEAKRCDAESESVDIKVLRNLERELLDI